eukprot:CAMPEP_0171171994 /NCGR_PEP_ID=MMETSP0790-20130122/9496_1 /TAXON_ID=2925 /ORGANISM="Alexandrium catenella, Strain OF101" /LENGTH=42 /DNA_ID= /DNA_START= /DNA_END= /DNA_ORIENTATION=
MAKVLPCMILVAAALTSLHAASWLFVAPRAPAPALRGRTALR